jgi:nucleotide-binding universal stress UspA family protein
VCLIVLLSALANFFTKPVATMSGLTFTGAFLCVFLVTEAYHRRTRIGKHEHLEQFNRATVSQVDAASLGLTRPYCKLVAIRSPQNLFMLDKALADADPENTDVIVMTAKVAPRGADLGVDGPLDAYDQQLLTAVVNHAERLGKPVQPLLIPTNNPLHAVLNTAKNLPAQEVVLGASNKYTAEEQLDQLGLYWINLHGGEPRGLTIHIVSADRDLTFDLHGGGRIPKAGERQAKSVADLRSAGIGIRRVLFAHDGALGSRDVFEWLITMLAPEVALDVVPIPSQAPALAARDGLREDQERAARVGRNVNLVATEAQSPPEVVRLARTGAYDLLVVVTPTVGGDDRLASYVRQYAPCSVFLAAHPEIPRELVDVAD